jgi:hypothetical protein
MDFPQYKSIRPPHINNSTLIVISDPDPRNHDPDLRIRIRILRPINQGKTILSKRIVPISLNIIKC